MKTWQIERRGFVLGALAGIGCAGVARAATVRPELQVTRLGGKMFMIAGAGANVLAAVDADGVLLVDGGSAEHTRALLKLVAAESGGKPVRTLFNTHWHWNHTGSNETLARQGATIIAHENTRLWLGAEIVVDWEQRTYPPRPPQAWPTHTIVYKPGTLPFNGQQLRYGYLPQAHTDGDIYVHFPRENLLVAGGVVSAGRYPIPDYSTGGWIGGLVDATKQLIALCDDNTRIVPGFGPVLGKADLNAQLKLCEHVRDRIGETYRKAESFEDLHASAPTKDFDARFGNPELFLRLAYLSARGHERDLGGIF